MPFTLANLLAWLGNTVSLHGADAAQAAALQCHGVVTDSRAVVPGNVFVALRGEKFDAHDFIGQVVASGAAAVVVERVVAGCTVPQLVVADTRVALGQMGYAWRSQFAVPVIGVTGSNGKTTVKEMIAAILVAAHGEAHALATRGNFNNEIGVPLTLFRLQQEHHAAVIELGMNHPGEIAVLSAIARPTVALVNNAQREHQEFMATVEAVARENGSVISSLAADGVAVFPADDTYTPLWQALAGDRRVVSFGFAEGAHVTCTHTTQVFGSDLRVVVRDAGSEQAFDVRLSAVGLHNVRNALAAIACAVAAGIGTDAIVRGLESFAPVSGRLQRKQASNGALLIDDTYNANPDSVRAAIDVLAQVPGESVLVLGDMGEVGTEGVRFHEEVGAYAREKGIAHLVATGELMVHAVQAFNRQAGQGQAVHFTDVAALSGHVASLATAQATVLVKGSRFMKMERVVQHLDGTAQARNTEGAH